MNKRHPYYELLDKWVEAAEMKKRWEREENKLRAELFGGTFPNPTEGVNKHELPDGRVVKGTYKLNRKIDEAALPSVEAAMRDKFQIDPESNLIRRKPELAVGAYKKLTEEQRAVFDEAVISKPGSPTIEIV